MPVEPGEPFRGQSHVLVTDATGAQGFAVSLVDVDPTAAATDQLAYEIDPTGVPSTLRFEWAVSGAPGFAVATAAVVQMVIPGAATPVGAPWAIPIATNSGLVTRTVHGDNDPLNQILGALRTGMLEALVTVTFPGSGQDSRGSLIGPVGTVSRTARGVFNVPVLVESAVASLTVGGGDPPGLPSAACTGAPLFVRQEHMRCRVTLKGQPYQPISALTVSAVRQATPTQTVVSTANAAVPTGSRIIDVDLGPVNGNMRIERLDLQVALPSDLFVDEPLWGMARPEKVILDNTTVADSFTDNRASGLGLSHSGHIWSCFPTNASWLTSGGLAQVDTSPTAAAVIPGLAVVDVGAKDQRVAALMILSTSTTHHVNCQLVACSTSDGAHRLRLVATHTGSFSQPKMELFYDNVSLDSFFNGSLFSPGHPLFLEINVDVGGNVVAWAHSDSGRTVRLTAVLTGPQLASLGTFAGIAIDKDAASVGKDDGTSRVSAFLAARSGSIENPESIGNTVSFDDFGTNSDPLEGRVSGFCDPWHESGNATGGEHLHTAAGMVAASPVASGSPTLFGALPGGGGAGVTVTPGARTNCKCTIGAAGGNIGVAIRDDLFGVFDTPGVVHRNLIFMTSLGIAGAVTSLADTLFAGLFGTVQPGVPLRAVTSRWGDRVIAWIDGKRIGDVIITAADRDAIGSPAVSSLSITLGSQGDLGTTLDTFRGYTIPGLLPASATPSTHPQRSTWVEERALNVDPTAIMLTEAQHTLPRVDGGDDQGPYNTGDMLYLWGHAQNSRAANLPGETVTVDLRSGDDTASIHSEMLVTDAGGWTPAVTGAPYVVPPPGVRIQRVSIDDAITAPPSIDWVSQQILVFGLPVTGAPPTGTGGLIALILGVVETLLGGTTIINNAEDDLIIEMPDECAVGEPVSIIVSYRDTSGTDQPVSGSPLIRIYRHDGSGTPTTVATFSGAPFGTAYLATWTPGNVGPVIVEATAVAQATGSLLSERQSLTVRHKFIEPYRAGRQSGLEQLDLPDRTTF